MMLFGLMRMLLRFLVFFFLVLEIYHFFQDSELNEISRKSLFLIELITIFFLILAFFTARKGYLLLCFLYVPIPLVLWEFIKERDKKRDVRVRTAQEAPEVQRLTEVLEKADEPAIIYKALFDLGDMFLKREDYEKAIEFYTKADLTAETNKLAGFPELSFKLKMAEKENKIKKGEIWVCSECSFDNSCDMGACKNCGNIRDFGRSLKNEITGQGQDIKQDILHILWVIIAGIAGLYILGFSVWLALFLYQSTPLWLFIPSVIILYTLLVFGFIKGFTFVKYTVIPKLLERW